MSPEPSPPFVSAADVLRARWRVQEDDEIGGWCVTLDVPGTPAAGNRPILSFVDRAVAEYVVMLHHKVLGPDLTALGEVMQEYSAAFGQRVNLTIFDKGTGERTRLEADPPSLPPASPHGAGEPGDNILGSEPPDDEGTNR